MTYEHRAKTDPILLAFHKHLRDGKKELMASRAAIKDVELSHPERMDALNDAASRATFSTRRYGNMSYCWAEVDNKGTGDPWPSTRFPHAPLRIAIATHGIA